MMILIISILRRAARKVLNSASKALTLFSEGSPVVGYPGTHFGDF